VHHPNKNASISKQRHYMKMPPIDDALTYINTFKAGKHSPYREIARKYGVKHTTLARRYKGKTVAKQV
jgi:hypothetical protein